MSKLHTEQYGAEYNTRHRTVRYVKQTDRDRDRNSVSREGLAPIVRAYSRLILVDGSVL